MGDKSSAKLEYLLVRCSCMCLNSDNVIDCNDGKIGHENADVLRLMSLSGYIKRDSFLLPGFLNLDGC
jgi:hypothetical protein